MVGKIRTGKSNFLNFLNHEKIEKNVYIAFKAKVVLETLKERSTIQQLAVKYNLHPNQITAWRKEFIDNADSVFEVGKTESSSEVEKQKDELYKQIGQLQVENNWLKKKVL